MTDLEAQRLATVENVQRADMHPMDEAEAFARMLALKDTEENIAECMGLSLPTVRKRIALAKLLAPQVKTAFRDGRMNLAQAQAFTLGSIERQQKLLPKRGEGRPGELFAALLKYEHLPELFGALVARHVGTWCGYRAELGDTPLAVAIAVAVGADVHRPEHGGWVPTAE